MISKEVNRADLGNDWPLKVDGGILIRDGMAVFFKYKERTYAVNGTASNMGGEDINPIWRNLSSCGTGKKNIQPLINMGLDLS